MHFPNFEVLPVKSSNKLEAFDMVTSGYSIFYIILIKVPPGSSLVPPPACTDKSQIDKTETIFGGSVIIF